MWCHLILFMPALALPVFFVLPLQAALPIYLFLVALSGLVYVAIVKAFRLPIQTGREGMIGKTGEVVVDLQPEGVVRYQNELWSARASERLVKGEKVVIVNVDNLKVIVRRVSARPVV
ncbi:MAG: hypothetical protein HY347_05425 [candidate division NC10 bacterium]|nr:hypothetical protein [candidate division NC10 bacterium]